MNLSPIERLDFMLDIVIKKHKGVAKLLQISTDAKKKMHYADIDTLIKKLMDDGYLEKPWGNSNPLNDTHYKATLDGEIFYLKGGYANKFKEEKAKVRKDEMYTYSVAIGTAFAGLYGFFEMAQWLMHHFNKHLPF